MAALKGSKVMANTTGNDVSSGSAVNISNIERAMYLQALSSLRKGAFNIAGTMELDPIESRRFMQNYQLGDYVTTAIVGLQWSDYIREIKIDITPGGGEIVTPTVCDPWKFYWSIGRNARDIDLQGTNVLNLMRTK